MSNWEFGLVLVFVIIAGGYVGCVADRWRRRPSSDEDRYPRRWVESIRMDRLHVIDDEWPIRKEDR